MLRRLLFITRIFISEFKDKLEHLLTIVSAFVTVLAWILLIFELAFPPAKTAVSMYVDIHSAIVYFFAIDVVIRLLFLSKKRWLYFLVRPTDFLVFLPWILQWINLDILYTFFVSQIVLIVILLGRIGHLTFLMNLFKVRPAQFIILAFLFTIFLGTLLLALPNATVNPGSLTFMDAFFTACSAVCVTGLTVNNVGQEFSFFGQLIILLLIQVGGLGIMSFSVLLSMVLGRRIAQADSVKLQESYSTFNLKETFSAIGFIFKFTLFFEFIGAGLLLLFWYDKSQSLVAQVFSAIFHSVSSFCNAGFSLFTDSLVGFQSHSPTIFTISTLIILGGLGFPVLFNLYQRYVKTREGVAIKLHTKIVLMTTLMLIISGTLLIVALEYHHSLSHLGLFDKIQVAYFQAVSARTAGFHSIDLNAFQSTSIMILMGLMIIGASPGSTGGGIKTTAFALMLLSFWNVLKNSFRFDYKGRSIHVHSILKAFSLFIVTLSIIFVSLFSLKFMDAFSIKDSLFEIISAFGTVGFSLGITDQLSDAGKFLMIVLMFIGRIGPLTFLYSIFRPKSTEAYELPVEKVTVV